jgi:AcrR family transcriptional regulator
MSNRQKIGLRKTHSGVQQRGVERRQKLLKSAYDLLCLHDIEDISFREIAAHAGVPEGSAYHFYSNRFDLYTALANDLSELFLQAHQQPVPPDHRSTWQDLAAWLVDVGARVYADNPPAMQLLIGSKTPPEVKQTDRMNDHRVADQMFEVFNRYFEMPDNNEMRRGFYYFIEISDLMFTLGVIDRGEITAEALAQAKRAGIGYLASFFDPAGPARRD